MDIIAGVWGVDPSMLVEDGKAFTSENPISSSSRGIPTSRSIFVQRHKKGGTWINAIGVSDFGLKSLSATKGSQKISTVNTTNLLSSQLARFSKSVEKFETANILAVSDSVVDESLRRSLYDHLLELEFKRSSEGAVVHSGRVKNIVDPHLYGATNPSRCISSIFRIEPSSSKSYRVKIKSEINNLDYYHYNGKEIYQDLESIFARMLPLFEEVTGLLLCVHGMQLEVIVKIQSFEFVVGESIESQVIDEGKVENLVATGLYFFESDPGIQGGALELLPLDNSPQTRVSPKVGTCLVFSNQFLASRLSKSLLLPEEQKGKAVISAIGNLVTTVGLDEYTKKISGLLSDSIGSSVTHTNPAERKLHRQFVSFAIVDPTEGMKVPKGAPSSSQGLPVNLRYHHLRALEFSEFPRQVKEILIDYLIGTIEQAYEIRAKLFEYRDAELGH